MKDGVSDEDVYPCTRSVVRDTPMFGPAERGFEPLHEDERHDLDPRTATLWGIVAACLRLIVLAFAWWPL